MITKNRIAMIRLSNKLDNNPVYAKHIGVAIELRKPEEINCETEIEKKQIAKYRKE